MIIIIIHFDIKKVNELILICERKALRVTSNFIKSSRQPNNIDFTRSPRFNSFKCFIVQAKQNGGW